MQRRRETPTSSKARVRRGALVVSIALAAPGCGGKSAKEPEAVPGVRFVGRTDTSDPSAVKFSWSATGFVATVRGPKVSISLETSGTNTVFFQPVIDGIAGE